MPQEKWNYKVINIKLKAFANAESQTTNIEDELNKVGLLGWELVNTAIAGTSMTAVFKR